MVKLSGSKLNFQDNIELMDDTMDVRALFKEKDRLLLRILELSSTYQNLKEEEQRLLSAAHLHLASAKIVLGHQRLSRDSFDYRMQSQVSLSALEEWFLASAENLPQQMESAKDHHQTSSYLRQMRRTTGIAERGSATQDSTILEGSDARPPVDPLRWFGGLAPQALRSAQTDFQHGALRPK